jgi:REP element-mobilizing transposase RayT
MSDWIPTESRWRSQLPHWEVRGAWHFVTIRCHGSLPDAALERIRGIHDNLQNIESQSPEFAQLQRQYFLTTEKYLDIGNGFAPFRDAGIGEIAVGAIRKIETEGWQLGDGVIMPNHVHLLMRKVSDAGLPLRQALERLKGRSARLINKALKRTGRFWQEDWFDRWMRDEAEHQRTIQYIRNNPVKAGLCQDWASFHGRIEESTDKENPA